MNMLTKNQTGQQGSTLVVSLVMLVVLTLLVVSAIRSSNINLRIAGNMQLQEESIAAAQQGIEYVLSNNFTTNPSLAVSNIPPVTIGMTIYTANVLTPVCNSTRTLANAEPNLPKECVSSGTSANTGIMVQSAPAATGTSWCLSQQWEIQTNVTNSGATTSIHQGVSLSVPIGTTCS